MAKGKGPSIHEGVQGRDGLVVQPSRFGDRLPHRGSEVWVGRPAGSTPAMPRKRSTDEQIIGIFREAEAGGKTRELCRGHRIREQTS